MKILNAYAGIGGNRKLWGDDHEITAIEYDKNIAAIYSDYYPDDEMVIADAHRYILEHFKEYDFIWTPPPCPSHSQFAKLRGNSDDERTGNKSTKPIYPDMTLYQQIIFLQHYFEGKYCVENVEPYYQPLIPSQKRGRHLFWSNFYISDFKKKNDVIIKNVTSADIVYGYDLKNYTNIDKRKVLRNMVNPELGKHILDAAIRQEEMTFFNMENRK